MHLYPTSLILVAVINDRRDLEIARLLGWYRIPLRSAPKVVAVDYLAFYQTAEFGEDKWRIQYIAQVRGHELTTRAELLQDELDHPHASQEYYKIQLGPLIPLPKPILAENWRRITFLYTTGEHFINAETVNDLIIPEEERQIIWQALRERSTQAQEYQVSDQMEIDPGLLLELLGIREAQQTYNSASSETSRLDL